MVAPAHNGNGKREVQVTIKARHAGFAFDLSAALYVDQIPGLIQRLGEVGIAPANSPYLWPLPAGEGEPEGAAGGHQASTNGTSDAPRCPTHGRVMRPSKHREGEFYCTVSIGTRADGSRRYCLEKVTVTA